ncbi:MAG: hypothetical protein RLZZ316_2778 [Bacteroidota bacterium]
MLPASILLLSSRCVAHFNVLYAYHQTVNLFSGTGSQHTLLRLIPAPGYLFYSRCILGTIRGFAYQRRRKSTKIKMQLWNAYVIHYSAALITLNAIIFPLSEKQIA